MSYSSVSLSLFDKLSGVSFSRCTSIHQQLCLISASPFVQVREVLSFPPLLSVSEDDAALQNVFSAQATLQCALDFDNSEVSISNLDSEFDAALSNTESDLAKLLLDR